MIRAFLGDSEVKNPPAMQETLLIYMLNSFKNTFIETHSQIFEQISGHLMAQTDT